MDDGSTLAALTAANEAAGCGRWEDAFELLMALDAESELAGEHLPLLAEVAYGVGDLDVTINAWERLHAAGVDAGDHLTAAGAAVRVAMHLMMDTGLMAPVRGWLARAERLLDGHDETPVHAFLAMVRTYERLMSGDVEATRLWADRTIEVATRQGEPGAAAVGRVAASRVLIFDGQVDEGLALLDEAAVATVSGELDPLSVGMVYCEVICAMQGLAQYDRAAQWTETMTRWSHSEGIGSLNGRCRVHRAELLRLRGHCDEAEDEARQACEELRPWMRREFGWPLTELGHIRLRRGDLDGAEEAFLAAHDSGWDPQPGLALLRLAQGDVGTAYRAIRHALDRPSQIPSKERPPNHALCRAPLLDAAVEIAVASGDVDWAVEAAEELGDIAHRFQSKALAASAALAQGRVHQAAGDDTAAGACFEKAVVLWSDVGAPYETSVARLGLAQAHRASGDDDRATMELNAARSTLERIGVTLLGERAGLTREDQQRASTTPPATDDGVFRRDGDIWTVAFHGEHVLLRDLKGLRYLARLLREPGREFHVLDLVTAQRATPTDVQPQLDPDMVVGGTGDLGPLLDEQAKATYRRRLSEIDEDIEEARSLGDTERVAMARNERDFLVRELSRAVGLGGRDRPTGSTSERARASVTRAIRYAMDRIAEHHRSLADHLTRTIRTGTYCAYEPDPRLPIVWEHRTGTQRGVHRSGSGDRSSS